MGRGFFVGAGVMASPGAGAVGAAGEGAAVTRGGVEATVAVFSGVGEEGALEPRAIPATTPGLVEDCGAAEGCAELAP